MENNPVSVLQKDEFPILCETCLGDNPLVRMSKMPAGRACKICERPFTVYRWKAGSQGRYKKTELCPTCAKLKNVCQTCVLDLQFGLPVQVRDAALAAEDKITLPESEVGKLAAIEQFERKLITGQIENPYDKTTPSAMLEKLQRKNPYFKRNEAHICSFFAAGTCNRGQLCPYRHEMPNTGELAKQNIKDRYTGTNDPVANKMLNRYSAIGHNPNVTGNGNFNKSTNLHVTLTPPTDSSVTTLWIGGIDEDVNESMLRQHFYVFGEISTIRCYPDRGFAFLSYFSRAAAEEAAAKLTSHFTVNGKLLKLAWGRGQSEKDKIKKKQEQQAAKEQAEAGQTEKEKNNSQSSGFQGPPGLGSQGPGLSLGPILPPPGMTPNGAPMVYPSQNPLTFAAKFTNAT